MKWYVCAVIKLRCIFISDKKMYPCILKNARFCIFFWIKIYSEKFRDKNGLLTQKLMGRFCRFIFAEIFANWMKERTKKTLNSRNFPLNWTWRVWTSRTMSCKSFSFPKVGPTNGQMVGWFSGARSFVLFSCLLPLKWWPNCGSTIVCGWGEGVVWGAVAKEIQLSSKE